MGKSKSPKSNRAVYTVKISNRNVISRLKITTGDFLGLKKADGLVVGKKNHIKRGAKGTKSFALVLKKATTVSGVKVQKLYFPVDGKVTVLQFYAYAKSNFNGKGVGAIITPDGILYAWDKIDHSKGGGLSLPSLPSLPGLPSLPDDALKSLGSYLGGEFGPAGSAVGGAIGGYLDDIF